MITLLTPRLLAARRQWQRAGRGRPLVLAAVGSLFLTAGYRIGTRVLDHFVVGDSEVVSFAERGLL